MAQSMAQLDHPGGDTISLEVALEVALASDGMLPIAFQFLRPHLAPYTRIFAIQFVVILTNILTLLRVCTKNFVLINYFAPILLRVPDSVLDRNDACNPGLCFSRGYCPTTPLLIYD
jgi:hypothetical protein